MAEQKLDFDSADFDWSAYLASRPPYPESLYNIIFDHHKANSDKWEYAYDMGTGVGVVAAQLSSRFEHITASDPSSHHISVAPSFVLPRIKQQNVEFLQCKAEDFSKMTTNSVDLITIAEAVMYTEYPQLIASASYLLRSGGTFAAWVYDIVPRLVDHASSEQDEVQTKIYQVFDTMVSFVVSKLGTAIPPLKLWSEMTDLKFDRNEWTIVRRLYWKRHRKFGEWISTLIDENSVTNQVKPWEGVEEHEESCMIVRNVDMNWLRVYLDALYPNVRMSEACPNELAALERMMQNGKRVDLAFSTSLVLATKR